MNLEKWKLFIFNILPVKKPEKNLPVIRDSVFERVNPQKVIVLFFSNLTEIEIGGVREIFTIVGVSQLL